MTSEQISQMTSAYASNGGKVKKCADGDTAIRKIPAGLLCCECGCRGDFTEHSMRAGESGRCASIIIR